MFYLNDCFVDCPLPITDLYPKFFTDLICDLSVNYPDFEQWLRKRIEDKTNTRICLDIDSLGKANGILILEFDGKYTINLSTLWVHPDARGQGVGTRLTKRFDEQCTAKGACFARVTVANLNSRATSLFKKIGFIHLDSTDYKNTGRIEYIFGKTCSRVPAENTLPQVEGVVTPKSIRDESIHDAVIVPIWPEYFQRLVDCGKKTYASSKPSVLLQDKKYVIFYVTAKNSKEFPSMEKSSFYAIARITSVNNSVLLSELLSSNDTVLNTNELRALAMTGNTRYLHTFCFDDLEMFVQPVKLGDAIRAKAMSCHPQCKQFIEDRCAQKIVDMGFGIIPSIKS